MNRRINSNIQRETSGFPSERCGDGNVNFARQCFGICIGGFVDCRTVAIFVQGNDGINCCGNGSKYCFFRRVAQSSEADGAGAAGTF